MKRYINILKILKIAGGSLLSMVIAERLGLNYAASAGVITLLSIHDTKRETIRMMVKRMAAFLIALLLAPICFYWLGYRPLAVGAFLLLFTPACTFLQLQEGISVSTVLMTHFLTEGSMSGRHIANEVLLLLVGTGIGVAMNLYIPGRKNIIRQKQHRIEEQFRYLLACMAEILDGGWKEGTADQDEYDNGFAVLEDILEQGEKDAYGEMENSLLTETRYYLGYMILRKNQLMVLRRIRSFLRWPHPFPCQAKRISGLFLSISQSFHEYNNAAGLLEELEQVKVRMRRQPLPATREEFEARAVLFQILLDLEQFLMMKRKFVENLSNRDIHMFWKIER